VSSGEADAAQLVTGLFVDFSLVALTCNMAAEIQVEDNWLGYTGGRAKWHDGLHAVELV
jgi:hypothetical protein